GDPARAKAQIERALTLAPTDATLHFLRAQELLLHGDIEGVMRASVDQLEAARDDADPMVQAMAEIAVSDVASFITHSSQQAELRARVEALAASPGQLSPAVRTGLFSIRMAEH